LGYKDGSLSNSLYHEIAGKIQQIIDHLNPDTLLTFDQLGISGHIDHITVSLICSYLYRENNNIKKLLYYGELAEVIEPMRKDYFIYMPVGYQKSDVDKVVDISQVWDIKLQAIRAHQSQSHDGEEIIKNAQKFPRAEYFKLLKK
jgi:LmbE family N-acetylglucosaminyl deacetylase